MAGLDCAGAIESKRFGGGGAVVWWLSVTGYFRPGFGGGAMGTAERFVLKQVDHGHQHMPEVWVLERDLATGSAEIAHTYWRVEGDYLLMEGEWTDRWPLAEARHRVPEEVWLRAVEIARDAGGGTRCCT